MIENIIEQHIVDCLDFGQEIDICESCAEYPNGIGYNELRYCWIDENRNFIVESNNVHDWAEGEDVYKKYRWNELTDYEKESLYKTIPNIVKEKSLYRIDTRSNQRQGENKCNYDYVIHNSIIEETSRLHSKLKSAICIAKLYKIIKIHQLRIPPIQKHFTRGSGEDKFHLHEKGVCRHSR